METSRRPGEAAIKKEFICPEWLARETKSNSNSQQEQAKPDTGLHQKQPVAEETKVTNDVGTEPLVGNSLDQQAENGGETNGGADNGIESGPPAKRAKKAKGQNKKRGLTVPRADLKTRMCKLFVEGDCKFGTSCKFSHDVLAYLSAKKADIGDRCVHFDVKGKCPYGVECRYGGSHIDMENGKNMVDQEKHDKFLAMKPMEMNNLANKISDMLRRKKYRFSDSEKVLRALNKPQYNAWKQGETSVPEKRDTSVVEEENDDEIDEEEDGYDDPGPQQRSGAEIREYLKKLSESSKSVDAVADLVGNGTSSSDAVESVEMSTNAETDSSTGAEVLNEAVMDTAETAAPQTATETAVTQIAASLTNGDEQQHNSGVVTDEDLIRLRKPETKKVDFSNKLYLAPLTTVGNLPFRRVCKKFGADITCGEMAMSKAILQGRNPELALLRRHHTEDIFGVQICGSYPDLMTRCTELLNKEFDVDFIDINMGCPIDLVFKKGEGSALMGRMTKLRKILLGMTTVSEVPITVKMRTGIYENKITAHKVIPLCREWGAELATLHGRTREQRYTKLADWDYINECAKLAAPMPLFGNGDILSYEDANRHREATGVQGLMIARGALIKPWIFQEIKEQRHWDISSSERFDMLKDFANYGLEHWGSDDKGVESTRRFLLEWLSFLNRYIPVGILEQPPQRINERPPPFVGRDDLETLFASKYAEDWVKISEMLLGPVPDNFSFIPKHKANSYS